MKKKKRPAIPKVRKRWVINPRIRIKHSIKKYKRSRAKRELEEIRKRVEKDEKDA